MRIQFTWKDPDWYDCDEYHTLSEDDRKRLRRLGAQENITLEYDTDLHTLNIVGDPK